MAIGITNYPAALDDNTSLVAATNVASTTLNGALSSVAVTITVVSTTLFPNSGIILIDSELISYTAKTATTFTDCTRAFESTTAASHLTAAAVSFVYTAKMRQALIDAIIAIQTKLGIGADVAANGEALVGTAAGAAAFRALVKADVGLANVDNTSDANKPVSTAEQTALNLKADDSVVVKLTGAQTVAGVKTFSSNPVIPDLVYGVAWNGSLEPPTKNAVYDKIETMGAGAGDMLLGTAQTVTGAKSFNPSTLKLLGGNYGASDQTLPTVVGGAFLLNIDSGRVFFGNGSQTQWQEFSIAGISGPVSAANGGTGVATLSGIAKGNGTSAFTVATEVWGWAISDEATALTTGTAKLTDRAPHAFTITEVRASLSTASTSGIVTVDIKKNGTTIFSTLLTLDINEKTSVTAAVPAVVSVTSIANDDELTFDITVAGTNAKGLKVKILGRQ